LGQVKFRLLHTIKEKQVLTETLAAAITTEY